MATLVMAMHFVTPTMATAEDEKTFSVLSLTDNISLSGLIEVEAGFSKDFDDVNSSDIVLATMELGIDGQLNEWCSGHIMFLWEEDDTEPVDLDEASITLGGTENYPAYLTAGKIYVPFGVFESNMISDPLTLEIGETREGAVQIGVEVDGFYGSIFAFNGDISEGGDEDDTIEGFGANAGYVVENDDFCIDFGIDWISNMLDSDGLGDGFMEDQAEFIGANPGGSYELKDYVTGLGIHVVFITGPFSVIGEYIGATDDPEFNTDDSLGTIAVEKCDAPKALHIEGAFTTEAREKEVTLALTYQSTDNLGGVLPEVRYGAAVRIGLADQLGLAFEYIHDEDYDEDDEGTDESANTFTVQLGLEF